MTSSATTASSPRSRPALDRTLSLRLSMNWHAAAYLAVFAAAFALRFWDLGGRSLGHDESIHAQWSWRLLRGDYQHDPVFHGPLYYHAQGLTFLVFGTSDYTSRLSAAIFGMGMVALPLVLRRRLGTPGTLAAMALIALSPSLVYYSRHIREDIYMAFFTLVMVAGMWRYIDGGRERWLLLFAVGFVGSVATKEATFLTAAVFLLFLNGHLASDLARATLESRGQDERWRRAALAAGMFPVAWLVAALWPFLGQLRRSAAWPQALPRPGDVLVLLGTMTVPFLTPFLKDPLISIGVLEEGRLEWRSVCTGAGPTAGRDGVALAGLFAITTSAAAFIGLQWRPRLWSICFFGGAAAYLTLTTSTWTNLDGVCTGPWGSLDYWLTQQGTERGNQPWFYYYMVLPVFEFLPLALCVAGAWWSLVRGDAFSRFCWMWMLGTLLTLSMAGEKMPWLNIHIALPAIVLAAWTVGRVWRNWDSPPEPRRLLPTLASIAAVAMGAALLAVFLPGGAAWLTLRLTLLALAAAFVVYAARPYGKSAAGVFLVVVLVGGLGVFSLRTMTSISFGRVDEPRDLLMYAEIGPDVPEVKAQIDALAEASGKGFTLRIAVDSAHTWPWPWYLRDYSRANSVTYTDMSEGPPEGDYDVLLVDSGNAGAVNDWIADTGSTRYASPRQYIQLWWPNEAYKLAIPSGPFRTVAVSDSDFAVPYWPQWGTWRHIASGYFQDGWMRTSYDYWRDREAPGGNIQNEAFAYFPANFNPETGKLGATTVEPPGPTVDDEGRPAFGGFGNLPGQFIAPVDVAADGSGNLYVIDSSTRKLQKFDSAGNYLAGVDIRNTEENPDESAEPWGVTVANGLVVVADTFGWKVRVFTTDLVKLTEFGQAPAADPPGEFDLFGPRDAIITAAGEIWITDTGHDRIMVYTPDGAFVRQVGDSGAGPGQLDEPVGLAVGPDGNVYVADMYNSRVQVFDSAGAFVREFEVAGWGGLDSLDKPYLAVLRDGSVAVSLPAGGIVRVYDAEGAELAVIPSLSRPYGIVEGADGRLWVSEGASGRLRLFEIPR